MEEIKISSQIFATVNISCLEYLIDYLIASPCPIIFGCVVNLCKIHPMMYYKENLPFSPGVNRGHRTDHYRTYWEEVNRKS